MEELKLYGDFAGAYFSRVFRADWRGGVWWISLGVLAVVSIVTPIAGAMGVATIRFEEK